MSEFDTGAAPAAAESTPASADQVVQTPNPVRTEPQTKAPEKTDAEAAPKPSAREAIAKARDKLNEQEKADAAAKPVKSDPKTDTANADPKAAVKTETTKQASDEVGRDKPKETATDAQQQPKQQPATDQQQPGQKTRYEAPKRFSSDQAAMADWEKAPESVQAAVHRVLRENEDGITKYKASHERYEQIKEFDETARSNGHDLRKSLEKVVGIEQAFARNPAEGFQRICDHFGINAREFAAHVAGMKPEQVQVQQDQTISELRRELAGLKEQIGSVSTTFQKQQTAATTKEVEAFAGDNPRFYDLMDDVAFFLKSDRVDQNKLPLERLKDAYSLAERLNPAPAGEKADTTAAASDADAAKASDATSEALAAQARKGGKSISGAPNAGSDPAHREPSTSVKDSLKRAFAQAG